MKDFILVEEKFYQENPWKEIRKTIQVNPAFIEYIVEGKGGCAIHMASKRVIYTDTQFKDLQPKKKSVKLKE